MRAVALPSTLLTVPNVTAHPSTASVLITVLLCGGSLLCGFNVAIKGLIKVSNHCCSAKKYRKYKTMYIDI